MSVDGIPERDITLESGDCRFAVSHISARTHTHTHTHTSALLHRIALSSVVCRSFCRSVSVSALQKRLKRSSCHLRFGLGCGQWTTY